MAAGGGGVSRVRNDSMVFRIPWSEACGRFCGSSAEGEAGLAVCRFAVRAISDRSARMELLEIYVLPRPSSSLSLATRESAISDIGELVFMAA